MIGKNLEAAKVQITAGSNDIADAVALRLSPIAANPMRFKPSHGKLRILFGRPELDKEGLLLITAELPGNFVADFEFSLDEFAKNPTQALNTLADELKEAHGAAIYRRNHETNITNKMFAELK